MTIRIKSLKLACFSPTGTTKTIIQSIAHGINLSSVELLDITKPGARKQPLQTSENELLMVAVPVYMGRVPALLNEWLHAIKAHNTPVICIVVYGNCVYENALHELRDILIKRGCLPIAGAAFVGEHSYSSQKTPVAKGRPDESDLNYAELFGRKINERIRSFSSVEKIPVINVPGNYPNERVKEIWSIDFIAVSNDCIQCGICSNGCPVDAIDPENSILIDKEKCITCCACIKKCPQNARAMKTSLVKDTAIRLNKRYKKRKEPEYFL